VGLPLETIQFSKLEGIALDFFDFFPPDWKQELFPQWKTLSESTEIFVLSKDASMVTLGLVFNTNFPHFSPLEKIAFKDLHSYPYIGYVYTLPEYRNQGYGKQWFKSLLENNTMQNYWLTIENLELEKFYTQLEFKLWKGNPQGSDEKVFTRF